MQSSVSLSNYQDATFAQDQHEEIVWQAKSRKTLVAFSKRRGIEMEASGY